MGRFSALVRPLLEHEGGQTGGRAVGRRHRANADDGCNGCTRRSLAFAAVHSPSSKSLQTVGFGERERTGANGRQHFAMQKVVGSSPIIRSEIPANRQGRYLIGKRWLHRGCTRRRFGPAISRFTRSPSTLTCLPSRPDSLQIRRLLPEGLCVWSTARGRGGSSFGRVHRFLQKVIARRCRPTVCGSEGGSIRGLTHRVIDVRL
jgi:hypothetical protein